MQGNPSQGASISHREPREIGSGSGSRPYRREPGTGNRFPWFRNRGNQRNRSLSWRCSEPSRSDRGHMSTGGPWERSPLRLRRAAVRGQRGPLDGEPHGVGPPEGAQLPRELQQARAAACWPRRGRRGSGRRTAPPRSWRRDGGPLPGQGRPSPAAPGVRRRRGRSVLGREPIGRRAPPAPPAMASTSVRGTARHGIPPAATVGAGLPCEAGRRRARARRRQAAGPSAGAPQACAQNQKPRAAAPMPLYSSPGLGGSGGSAGGNRSGTGAGEPSTVGAGDGGPDR